MSPIAHFGGLATAEFLPVLHSTAAKLRGAAPLLLPLIRSLSHKSPVILGVADLKQSASQKFDPNFDSFLFGTGKKA